MANFDTLFKPTIDRLAHLILRQYGCQMEYLHLTELQRAVLPTARHQLAANQTVTSGESIFIPVFLNRKLAGAAQIMHAYDLSSSELRLIQQIVQTVIESTLMNLDRMELLSDLEAQLKHVEQNHNVLPLSHFRPNPNPVENRKSNDQFDFACLIESRSQLDIFKMALEIHNYSGRYAFLPAKDLSQDVWEDFDQLQKLGPASIYIEEIADLSLERQEFIYNFLRSRVRKSSPQIIVGTTRTFAELRANPAINKSFLDQITVGYLHMSHSFATYQKENLLDFFFNGLTGRSALSIDGINMGLHGGPSPDQLPPH
jgi:hypothetical protein